MQIVIPFHTNRQRLKMNKNQIDQYIKISCKTTDMFNKLKSFIMEKNSMVKLSRRAMGVREM